MFKLLEVMGSDWRVRADVAWLNSVALEETPKTYLGEIKGSGSQHSLAPPWLLWAIGEWTNGLKIN